MEDSTPFGDGTGLAVIVVVWIAWTAINCMVAKAKNFEVASTLVASLVLSPFFTYLYIAAIPPAKAAAGSSGDVPDYMKGR